MRILITSVLLGALTLGLNGQSVDRASRFVKSPVTGPFVSAVPLRVQRPVTVVLKLIGDPVAVVRGRAPGKQISDGQRDAIEQSLRAQQDALMPAIAARGASVLATFQHAINGIKVQGTPAQIAALATLPGVVEVKPVATYKMDNATTVPFIGAPAAWQGPPGLHGEHIKIAIIDTGIDYTHANFGGPGTVAAFAAAAATSTLPADPTMFGPLAPKVKGGTDLVGDNYDAAFTDAAHAPKPEPNPLDCAAHGSHVAGTAAGFGVLNGATFTGPYDGSTPSHKFTIGPGVAPGADLFAVRVFGCLGSTNVVVDALDWAVKNGMQVVNMSLGSDFGVENSADSEASEHAVEAGIVVAAAAGNAGPLPYVAGQPAVGDKALSVAAMDSVVPLLPAASLSLNTGSVLLAQNSNGGAFLDHTALPIVVLRNPDSSISFGCNESEYVDATIAGKLVVALRGVCNRVARPQFGFKHGAAAVALINNVAGYPPFEGDIPSLSGGVVTIPFFGVQGATADGALLAAAAMATLSNTTLANPIFARIVPFSSQGPRNSDGRLKPDLTAPGTSVVSTAMGTGTEGIAFSGTSMATPHVAGTAALALQAHPGWNADQVATAIVNTADPSGVAGYKAALAGAGLVQPFPATRTWVIARGGGELPSLNFGVEEFSRDFAEEQEITVQNLGTKSASFSVSVIPSAGASPHTVEVNSFVSVAPGHSTKLRVGLKIPVATSGDSNQFRDVAGVIRLSPTTPTENGGAALSVPYYLVARARTEVETEIEGRFGPMKPTTARVENESAALPGTADFYAWGLAGSRKPSLAVANLRAAGVQSFNDSSFGQVLVFAVNTFQPWSSPVTTEYDVLLDVNGDGIPDFVVFNVDLGLIQFGAPTGQIVSAVLDLATGLIQLEFFAVAPTDGNTMLLPILASDVRVTSANPRFRYFVNGFDGLANTSDSLPGPAGFNAFTNAISTGAFVAVGPNGKASVPLTIDPTEWATTPSLGVMVVATENFTKGDHLQAQLLQVPAED